MMSLEKSNQKTARKLIKVGDYGNGKQRFLSTGYMLVVDKCE